MYNLDEFQCPEMDLDTAKSVLEALHSAFLAGGMFQYEKAKWWCRDLENEINRLEDWENENE